MEWPGTPVQQQWPGQPINSDPEEEKGGGGLGRQLGLTARHALAGPAKAVTGVNDAVNMAVNGVLDMLGVDYRQEMVSPLVDKALDSVGLPKPENATERVVGEASQFLSGAAVPIAAGGRLANAGPVARRVGETLAANPAMQATSTATGGAALQGGLEGGLSPGQAQALSLGASFLPGAAKSGASGAVRTGFRGRDPARMQRNIESFAQAGTTPSVGQASQARQSQWLESLVSKIPGGAGRMGRFASQQLDDVGKTADDLATSLARKPTAGRAGAAVESGVQGFRDRLLQKASQLYDEVDNYVNPSQPIELKNTREFFAKPSNMAKFAPNTARRLQSSYLEDLGIDLDADIKAFIDETGFDGLPYAAVKEIRSKVGEKLGNLPLVLDTSQKEIARLYGALSDDLTAFARKSGPQAARAADRANSFYRAGRERLDKLGRVVKKDTPEKIFKSLMSGTNEGATTLRTVMKSLTPEERNWMTGTVIKRMGRATPGNQDAAGEAFSLNTYLTNWNRLSPEAKNVLMAGKPKGIVQATDHIAKVAENVKAGSKVFSNPSGTSQGVTQNVMGVGAMVSAVLGSPAWLMAIGGTVAGANLTARLMTNPNFVGWLAKSTQVPVGAASQSINTLAQIAAQTGDDELATLAAALQEYQNNQQGNQRQGR